MLPDMEMVDTLIALAIREDVGAGDVTTNLTIPADAQTSLYFNARDELIACGIWIIERVYSKIGSQVKCEALVSEGALVSAGANLAKISGNAREILTGERVSLNLLIRMCSVATYASKFVKAVSHTKAQVLDTRKTMPAMRGLDKYACHIGGVTNHRMGLYDMVMIKDNHIAVNGSIENTVALAKAGAPDLVIEVEVDTMAQLAEALQTKADVILLDNFSLPDLCAAVAMSNGRKKLEASGGVKLGTIKSIAETGVDFISAGCITAAPPPVDIGLDYLNFSI